MPHGPSRDGPFGPPPIQREMPPYDAPPYWGQAPPAARYPLPTPLPPPLPPPPSHHPHHHPQHSQHGRSPHRVPPPSDYHHHHGPPQPQPPAHYHQSQHQQYGGRQWRDAERHYSPPPPPVSHYHHSSNRREASHDDYGRPYMSTQVEYEPPPPTYHTSQQTPRSPPTPPPPPAPQIQFRPNSRTDSSVGSSPTKKSGKDGKKKKGDALSLLAKVSTAMADPEEEEEKAALAAENAANEKAHHGSPPRRENPEKMWSTPKQQYNDRNRRQITPTSMDQHRNGPAPRGYYHQSHQSQQSHQSHQSHQSYPRYGHYASAPSSTQSYYRSADSPTALISERGSFEDDRSAPYSSPSRHYEEQTHYAPYTYVQQPRMEDKTILRKKFSWKHYPELERFLIANRDEYLRHSALNYTAEQKQYNNWLTERLLEVAARHHYVFDPEDFNFVAVRDRIRCYYKSYVQTARKRGLPLITQKLKSAKAEVE